MIPPETDGRGNIVDSFQSAGSTLASGAVQAFAASHTHSLIKDILKRTARTYGAAILVCVDAWAVTC
jgi:hypothetical protein